MLARKDRSSQLKRIAGTKSVHSQQAYRGFFEHFDRLHFVPRELERPQTYRLRGNRVDNAVALTRQCMRITIIRSIHSLYRKVP